MGLLDKVDIEVMDSVNANKRTEARTESVFSLYPEQDEGDLCADLADDRPSAWG